MFHINFHAPHYIWYQAELLRGHATEPCILVRQEGRQAVATTYHRTTPPFSPSLPPSACSQWAGGSWLEGDTLKADLPDRNKSNDQQRERFTRCLQVLSCPLILELELCPGLGSNWVTVTESYQVTAIFRNCNWNLVTWARSYLWKSYFWRHWAALQHPKYDIFHELCSNFQQIFSKTSCLLALNIHVTVTEM